MSLLNALGIDKYTRAFKTWIGNKFIAKGSLKTINNQSIEEEGNIETTIFTPESAGSTNRETTTESRVYRAFYNIQNDEFTINNGSEKKSVPLWHINKITALGEIVNINIEDEHSTLQSCTAKVTLLPTINIQFDYLDTHYTLTWITDTQLWDVTKTPINTGSADWNAQEGEAGYIENRTHYANEIFKGRFIYNYEQADIEYAVSYDGDQFNDNEGAWIKVLQNYWNHVDNGDEPIYKYYKVNYGIPTTIPYYYDDTITIEIFDIEVRIKWTNNENHISYIHDIITLLHEDSIIQLENKFIPDTVLKTTPQTLSDTDKNQALANLGIDPIVWKYICEPYHLSQDSGVPNDLKSVIFDEDGNLKDIVLKLVVVEINDDSGHYIYSAAKLSGDRRAVVPSDDYTEYAVSIYPDGTTSDW